MISNHSGFHLMISCHLLMELNTVMLMKKKRKKIHFQRNRKKQHVSTAVELIKRGAIKEGLRSKEGRTTSWQINIATILRRGTYSR